jgi:pimeloyl-ACP methyl ester carboxylesterase
VAAAESGRSGPWAHATAPAEWVLLHGAGGGAWEWNRWVRLLKAQGRVVHVPDFSRHCVANALGDGNAFSRLRTDVLDRLRLGSGCVLVGASLGGLLAAAIADTLQARALVLVNPALPDGSAQPRHRSGVMHDNRPWGLRANVSSTRAAVPELHPLDVLKVFRRWSDCSQRLLHEIGEGIDVPRPSMPCLLLCSHADAEMRADDVRRLAETWSTQLQWLRGSHVGPVLGAEAAVAVAQTFAWLRTHGF